MVGIIAYGVYVPLHRLGPETKGWYGRGEKAIANYNEDSITMAVAAGMNCLDGMDRNKIDGLFFASTTSPYKEKQSAALVATALDLRRDILTSDFTNSLRAGTIALMAAIDAVSAGRAKQILVTASDLRVPQPRSELEPVFGDGAAAILVGDSDVAISIEDSYSISDEILDEWRIAEEPFPRTWESRFVADAGYLRVLPEAVSELMQKTGLTPKDFAKAALYGPDSRRHTQMIRKLGFDAKTQAQDGMFGILGNTGTAFALMILSAALEEAGEGDRILLGSYGSGADAFLLQATEGIDKIKGRRNIDKYLHSKKTVDDYIMTYARWRGLIDIASAVRRPESETISGSATWRGQNKNIRFRGVRCKKCGYPQYPPQRVCTRCHSKDEFESYIFSDKKATLFTYSTDYVGSTLDPPMVYAVINFEGGGRAMLDLVDRDVNQLKAGMPLELTFRRLYTKEGIHAYYWCCTPIR